MKIANKYDLISGLITLKTHLHNIEEGKIRNDKILGLCILTDKLYLEDKFDGEKHNLIKTYIKNNKPKKCRIFRKLIKAPIIKRFIPNYIAWEYWYEPGKIEEREKWLEKHIKKQERIVLNNK